MKENTRVLACQIDADLRLKMKEHIAQKNTTVKAYITGLIKEDLEKNAVKTKQEEGKKTEEKVKENKIQEEEKENKEKQPIQDKKEEKETKRGKRNQTTIDRK